MNNDDPLLANHPIRVVRLRRGWSQQYVADQVGTTVVTVKRWERGSQSPGPHFRFKLCTLFDASAEELGLLPAKSSSPAPEEAEVSPLVESPSPGAQIATPVESLSPTVHASDAHDNTVWLGSDATDPFAASLQQEMQAAQPTTLQQQNRIRMLRRLHHSYRTLLVQSLQGTVWIDLGLAQKADAVRNTTTLLLRSTNQAEQRLPAGTTIMRAYEDAEGECLILGEPGTGKSTFLLHLAQQLIENAMQDDAHPLPVLLPLSSWAVKRPALQDWMVEQLTLIYDVPAHLAYQWVQEEHILPLLDGLDEMEEAARPACIKAINVYHREHLVPIVVCCRTSEYAIAARSGRLTLHTAIVIQPLSAEQIDTHLVTMGNPFVALRTTLRENAALQTVVTTPLMLQLLLLTYHDTFVQGLSHKEAPLRQQLWADYVQHMVSRKGDAKRYPPATTNTWLSWLARQMRQHNQTLFFLEQVQGDWLEHDDYQRWAVLLPNIFAAGLLGVLTSTLLFSSYFTLMIVVLLFILAGIVLTTRGDGTAVQAGKTSYRSLWLSLCFGIVGGLGASVISILTRDGPKLYHVQNGLSYGVASALLYVLLRMGRQHEEVPQRFSWSWRAMRGWFLTNTYGWDALNIGLSCAVGFGLHELFRRGPWYALGEGLRYGLLLGVTGVLLSVLMRILQVKKEIVEPKEMVESVEHVQWSWRRAWHYLFAWKHLRNALIIGLSIALIVGLGFLIRELELQQGFSWQKEGETVSGYGISISLIILSNYWFQQGYRGGLAQDLLPETNWLKPQRRIWSSARNALLIAGMSALMSWLSYGLSYKAHADAGGDWPNHAFLFGFLFGISGGVLSGLLYSGLICLRHLVLRVMLWRMHLFPWKATAFLDDATARILLRRVGNGYSFTHRLLMDHFAELPLEPKEVPVDTQVVVDEGVTLR